MTLPKFIKDNVVLLIGIFLPLLLVVFFILASAIPRMTATPPKYDFIFVTQNYKSMNDSKLEIRIKVDDGQLIGKVIEKENPARYYPEIYRYSINDNYAVPVKAKFFLDEIIEDKEELIKTKTVQMPKSLRNIKLDDNSVSPDGYVFDTSYNYRSGGIIGDIFSMRSRRCMYRLVKNNASFPFEIRQIGNNYYNCYYSQNNIKFLGWVISENTVKD